MFLLCFYVISVRSDKAKIRYRGGGGGGGGGGVQTYCIAPRLTEQRMGCAITMPRQKRK